MWLDLGYLHQKLCTESAEVILLYRGRCQGPSKQFVDTTTALGCSDEA